MGKKVDCWHKKTELASIVKDNIRKMVNGTEEEVIKLGGAEVRVLQVSGDVFKRVYAENRKYLYRGDFTAPEYENSYISNYNIVTESGLAGLSVSPDGRLVAAYSNEEHRGFIKEVAKFMFGKVDKTLFTVGGDVDNSKLAELFAKSFGLEVLCITDDASRRLSKLYGEEFVKSFTKAYGTPCNVFMGRKEDDLDIVREYDSIMMSKSAMGKVS